MSPFIFGIDDKVDGSAFLTSEKIYELVGENVGNLAFHYAMRKILDYSGPHLPWHAAERFQSELGTLGVMPCANQLGPHVDYGGLADKFSELPVKLIAVGLGAQGNWNYGEIPKIPDGTLRWVSEIVRRAPAGAPNIGVRGPFTLRVLEHYGFAPNAVVTGCPTLFINPDPNLGSQIASRLQRQPRRIAVAAGHQKWGHLAKLEASLARMVEFAGGSYVVQSPIEMLHLARDEADLLSEDALRQCRDYARPNMELDRFKEWTRAHARAFFSVSEWMEHLRGFDYVVGPRIHGVMLGLQAGIPSLCVAHDSRTRELCETLRVPFVMASDVKDGIEASALPELIKFDAREFDENRRLLADRLNSFLVTNRLPPSAWLKNVLARSGSSATGSAQLLVSAARQEVTRGDHVAAAQAWAQLRERHPLELLGYSEGISALRRVGSLDTAELVASRATELFPSVPQFAADYARLALERRDHALALRRWEDVQSRFPYFTPAIVGRGQASRLLGRLEDAERIVSSGVISFPNDVAVAIEYARIAFAQRDFVVASERWTRVRSLAPHLQDGYVGGMQCFRLRGLYAEAEALGELAKSEVPNSVDVWRESANLMDAQKNWSEAARRWRSVRERFDAHQGSLVAEARALRLSMQIEEAEALLENAMGAQHNSPDALIEFCNCAIDRRDWPEVGSRSASLRERFPSRQEGWSLGITALRQMNRIEEADELGRQFSRLAA